MFQIETNQRLANSFVDFRHCGNNHYLTKSEATGLLDIPFVNNKSMVLSPSNIIVSGTGKISETVFHIYLCTNVPTYTLVKRQKTI